MFRVTVEFYVKEKHWLDAGTKVRDTLLASNLFLDFCRRQGIYWTGWHVDKEEYNDNQWEAKKEDDK